MKETETSCQHCYHRIIPAHPDLSGAPVWVEAEADPNHHTLAAMLCMPRHMLVQHTPMPIVEVAR